MRAIRSIVRLYLPIWFGQRRDNPRTAHQTIHGIRSCGHWCRVMWVLRCCRLLRTCPGLSLFLSRCCAAKATTLVRPIGQWPVALDKSPPFDSSILGFKNKLVPIKYRGKAEDTSMEVDTCSWRCHKLLALTQPPKQAPEQKSRPEASDWRQQSKWAKNHHICTHPDRYTGCICTRNCYTWSLAGLLF
jgi:hypothetical protein